MAAGDLLTGPNQVEIQALLTGDTTDYTILSPPGIQGLGTVTVKNQDVQLDGQDGDLAGRDYEAPRIITVPYAIKKSTAAAVWDALTTLQTAWAPTTTDIELHGNVAGWDHWSVVGRSRGLASDDTTLAFKGLIIVMATFKAMGPTITKDIV